MSTIPTNTPLRQPDWDALHEYLEYRESTGELIWKKQPEKYYARDLVGQPAGNAERRYLCATIGGQSYRAHVLIWFMKTKEWRPGGVDHIDGDGANNRWSNLRACNGSQNNGNQRLRSDNTSGFKGVFHKGPRHKSRPWCAQIGIGGRGKRGNQTIGYFATAEEAAIAYDSAAIEYFGPFALTNKSLGLLK